MILFEEDSSKKLEVSQDRILTIKNALTIIIGEAEILLRNENLSEEGEKQLAEVKSQAWRINDLLPK